MRLTLYPLYIDKLILNSSWLQTKREDLIFPLTPDFIYFCGVYDY